ncbi:hypothetical protein HDV02_004131 [Globomyces sp. JEL0801]|nr:hypothetical protein HDV02_004131 [Globomyces sp. JEL0801]
MHAHMLSPFNFRNDLTHSFPHLGSVEFPLARLYSLLNSVVDVEEESESVWNRTYPESPYVLSHSVDESTTVCYDCPFCQTPVKCNLIAFEKMSIDPAHKQSYPCPKCRNNHSSESLSAKRLIDDFWVATKHNELRISGQYYDENGNTLGDQKLYLFARKPDGALTSFGKMLSDVKVFGNICNWEIIAKAYQDTRKECYSEKLLVDAKPVAFLKTVRYYRGYIHPFSIALPAAVLRQRVFSQKITSIDMDNKPTLQNAITRYQKWFKLMKLNTMLVPTLDIDLAWHTHLLSPQSYYKWCTDCTKNRIINHDDTIADGKLKDSLAKTAEHWYNAYKEPYTVCDNSKIEKFWNTRRVATSVIFPPFLLYAFNKERKLKNHYWHASSKEAEKNHVVEGRASVDLGIKRNYDEKPIV